MCTKHCCGFSGLEGALLAAGRPTPSRLGPVVRNVCTGTSLVVQADVKTVRRKKKTKQQARHTYSARCGNKGHQHSHSDPPLCTRLGHEYEPDTPSGIGRGHKGGVDRSLCSAPTWKPLCDDVDAAVIEALGVNAEVVHENTACNGSPS